MPKTRPYKTDSIVRMLAQERRIALKQKGLCINGPEHGAATHGVLCKRCRDQHRMSA